MTAVLLHGGLIGGDVDFEGGLRRREDLLAATVGAGDVVEVGVMRGMGGRFDRRDAGI